MKMRKQDYFRVVVTIIILCMLAYNTPETIDYYINGGEELMYYIAAPFGYIIAIGWVWFTAWEIMKYNEKP